MKKNGNGVSKMKNVSKIYNFCKKFSQKSYILILISDDLGVTLAEQTAPQSQSEPITPESANIVVTKSL